MHGRTIRFTSLLPHIPFSGNNFDAYRSIHILHKPAGNPFSLPIVSNTLRDELFREMGRGIRSGNRLHHQPHSSPVPVDEPRTPLRAAEYYDLHSPNIGQRG